jgi:hypothetical protein
MSDAIEKNGESPKREEVPPTASFDEGKGSGVPQYGEKVAFRHICYTLLAFSEENR